MPRTTWFDRALALLSPGAAARRVAARHSLDLLTRGYDGSARSWRTDGWRTAGTSADAEIGAAGQLLVDRSRDLTRNNPHAAKAVSALVNNIVGGGIIPRAASGEDRLDQAANALWERWSARCDATGLQDFYGLQTLACREMVEAGEVLVRRRPRRVADGLPVPLQLELLESDFLDRSKSQDLPAGARIVQGVEFDAIGRRRAYWLHAQHPGDSVISFNRRRDSAAIEAADVLHVYERQRVQVRGVPWGAPVIRALRDLDDWTQAELVRKKTEACLVGVVIGADADDVGVGTVAPSVQDSTGRPVERFSPGMLAYMRGGKDIRFNQPAAAGGMAEWLRCQMHIIAAGYRVPYELLTGDLSQVNYSSIRAGLVEFRRMIEAIQWQIFIPMLCQPVWEWFSAQAYVAGVLPRSDIPVSWTPPRFEAVDPLKDAQADLLAIRTGTMTLMQAIARQGYDPDTTLAEIARCNEKLDALGLVLDSDPRRVTKTGQVQQGSQETNDASEED